jgi:hypothetical protein
MKITYKTRPVKGGRLLEFFKDGSPIKTEAEHMGRRGMKYIKSYANFRKLLITKLIENEYKISQLE